MGYPTAHVVLLGYAFRYYSDFNTILYSYFVQPVQNITHPFGVGKIVQNTQSEPHGLPDGVRWYAEGELCAVMGDFNTPKLF